MADIRLAGVDIRRTCAPRICCSALKCNLNETIMWIIKDTTICTIAIRAPWPERMRETSCTIAIRSIAPNKAAHIYYYLIAMRGTTTMREGVAKRGVLSIRHNMSFCLKRLYVLAHGLA